jgi:hypothetical protein
MIIFNQGPCLSDPYKIDHRHFGRGLRRMEGERKYSTRRGLGRSFLDGAQDGDETGRRQTIAPNLSIGFMP